MAKLKAPLLSLGASQKLGNALVFFSWKGINVVREYVIPANPRSADQITQRGYMTDAVAEWHGALYSADDRTAWNRFAGTLAATMSGFNAMVREHMLEQLLGNVWERLTALVVSLVIATGFTVTIDKVSGGNDPYVRWGTTKTFFPDSLALVDQTGDEWEVAIPGLQADTLYYFYIDSGTSGTDYGRTGIYQQRTAA